MDDLLKTLRSEKQARIRFGKHPVIHYGNKSQSVHSSQAAQPSDLYLATATDKDNLYFSGSISHTLEVQKAKGDTAGADEALANLAQSLNAFHKDKELKKTQTINLGDVRALGGAERKKTSSKLAAPRSRFDIDKELYFKKSASQSIPASPALTAYNSPSLVATPTHNAVKPDKNKIRQEAIRVPFIHLLAVRSVSVKFLASQTRSSQEDCKELAEKYGRPNRLNPEKYDLKDKAYKDLDVWNFPYPTQDDRQSAIDNTVSAFDRMRISWNDKAWQLLLPPAERGKGKVLSKLDLRKGPLQVPAPRIHVENTDESSKEEGSDKPLKKAAGEAMARSQSSDLLAKKKASERDPAPKEPLNKPKSVAKNTKAAVAAPKKTDKKPAKSTGNAKFKSAEIIEDSDEDLDMEDAARMPEEKVDKSESRLDSRVDTKPAARKSPLGKGKESKNARNPVLNGRVTKPQPSPARSTTNKVPPKRAEANQKPTSRPRGTSSPQKPSPLGSSPPTNASDFDNGSSKTSSTSASTSPTTRIESSTTKKAAPPVRPSEAPRQSLPTSTSSISLKRKAESSETASRLSRPKTNSAISASKFQEPPTKRIRPGNTHTLAPSPSISSSSGSASPPESKEFLLRQLREKSEKFKKYYNSYRSLHERVARGESNSEEDLRLLRKQHDKLLVMKKAIWDEDSRLKRLR